MAPKMHAAVVEQFGKPLSLLELEIPSPGASQILVKTEACGVCHTDLHAAHGDWPVKAYAPVHSWPRGDRFGHFRWIGRDNCKRGRPGRGAVALLSVRSLRVLPKRLRDGMRSGSVRRLHR
jgi:D-arabinose 1-dehydrogenase-like Zn-dependent alcohol dehydrogenase